MGKTLLVVLIAVLLLTGGVFIGFYVSTSKKCESDSDCSAKTCFSVQCVNSGCEYSAINDCCGNEICEMNEFPACADCSKCDDKNELTTDSYNYETKQCENLLTHYTIDDFEEGLGNFVPFRKDELWNIETDNGNKVLRLGWNQVNIEKEFDNYIFKFRFKRLEGNMHANFKMANIDGDWNRYMINIHYGGVSTLGKQVGDNFQTVKEPEYDSEFSEGWHTMEIRNYNDIINVYLDEVLIIKYKDPNPIPSGRVGFEVHTGGAPVTPEFLIDDVEVKLISADDVVYP